MRANDATAGDLVDGATDGPLATARARCIAILLCAAGLSALANMITGGAGKAVITDFNENKGAIDWSAFRLRTSPRC